MDQPMAMASMLECLALGLFIEQFGLTAHSTKVE